MKIEDQIDCPLSEKQINNLDSICKAIMKVGTEFTAEYPGYGVTIKIEKD